jgi:hypothetical protein
MEGNKMTLLYVIEIDKIDEEGSYKEVHYFKSNLKACQFAMENSIENFKSMKFNDDLANQIAED